MYILYYNLQQTDRVGTLIRNVINIFHTDYIKHFLWQFSLQLQPLQFIQISGKPFRKLSENRI